MWVDIMRLWLINLLYMENDMSPDVQNHYLLFPVKWIEVGKIRQIWKSLGWVGLQQHKNLCALITMKYGQLIYQVAEKTPSIAWKKSECRAHTEVHKKTLYLSRPKQWCSHQASPAGLSLVILSSLQSSFHLNNLVCSVKMETSRGALNSKSSVGLRQVKLTLLLPFP